MKAKPVFETKVHQENLTTADLFRLANESIDRLGMSEGGRVLFPNGFESVDLSIQSGPATFSLRLKGAQGLQESAAVMRTADFQVEPFFNSEGHHVIALIATHDLETRDSAAMQKVQAILDAGNRDLLDAAVFPDVIRNDQPETKPFHFVDIPFKDHGPAIPALPGKPHVISKIAEFSEFLKHGGGTPEERVDALSWLIHLFGDIHQPMHCIEHTSTLHPHGDRGGNSFRLSGKAKNLHSLWDSSVSFVPKDDETLAGEVASLHPRSSLSTELKVADVEQWARASFKIAKENAYTLHENNSTPPKPSAKYLKNAEKLGKRQAALAGYRLSDRLRDIFG